MTKKQFLDCKGGAACMRPSWAVAELDGGETSRGPENEVRRPDAFSGSRV